LAALAALQGERRVPGQRARLTNVRHTLLSGIRNVAGVPMPNTLSIGRTIPCKAGRGSTRHSVGSSRRACACSR
jgi:hypothetical protein